jgi:hypothetical protein
MYASTIVFFFVVTRSKIYINVLSVGPVGTRTMTFTVGEKKPSWEEEE